MELKPVILAAVIFAVVAQVVHTAGAMATMGYYYDAAYFAVWSNLMMPAAGPPPPEFTYLSLALGFVTSFIFVYAYVLLKKAVPGKDWPSKGINYGILLFLISTVPSTFSMLMLINLPTPLIMDWALEGLVIALAGGLVTAKLN
ncbi:MAG: hypothetical protein PHV13_05530 [Candidatus ainarchaeum sp.]|nr:hypothetical protein [Candidatus ainarchaeum sp.]